MNEADKHILQIVVNKIKRVEAKQREQDDQMATLEENQEMLAQQLDLLIEIANNKKET